MPRVPAASSSSLTSTADLGSARHTEHGLLTRYQAWLLYILHFSFSWNARTYEYAAIIFTASTFPGTLTAASLRGVSTTVVAICFSAALGRWIDSSPSRLRSLTWTIWVHRCAVIAAYLVWLLIVKDVQIPENIKHDDDGSTGGETATSNKSGDGGSFFEYVLFAVILVLGMLEWLSYIANNFSVNREWLPVLAPSSASFVEGRPAQYDLSHLNAVLRRIDLICKLITPILVTMFVSIAGSYSLCIVVVGLLSVASLGVELWCAKTVFNSSPSLMAPKEIDRYSAVLGQVKSGDVLGRSWLSFKSAISDQLLSLRQYFSTTVWIPSFSQSLLHLTILAYSASFITYMLDAGFSLNLITLAGTTGSAVEVISTVVTPWAIHHFTRRKHSKQQVSQGIAGEDETDEFLSRRSKDLSSQPKTDSSVLEHVGLAGITWQFLSLTPVVISLFFIHSPKPSTSTIHTRSDDKSGSKPPHPQQALIFVLFTFLSLSRLGPWTYELTTQELTQILVPRDQLAAFAGVQESFQSVFELTHWIFTAVFGNPSHFPWLAVGSLGSVGVAAGSYALWVVNGEQRRQREDVNEVDEFELQDEIDEIDDDDDDGEEDR